MLPEFRDGFSVSDVFSFVCSSLLATLTVPSSCSNLSKDVLGGLSMPLTGEFPVGADLGAVAAAGWIPLSSLHESNEN